MYFVFTAGGVNGGLNADISYSNSAPLSFPAVACDRVWTGCRSPTPGSTNVSDWRWLYTTDVQGKFGPVTLLTWAPSQPNNVKNNQPALMLDGNSDFDFNDKAMKIHSNTCYLCECP